MKFCNKCGLNEAEYMACEEPDCGVLVESPAPVNDDDDAGAMWNALRKERREKRARNRDASARLLQEAGIPFESKNGGAHLIVAGRYDFWPGTGLWMARGEKTKQRGVLKLIRRVKNIQQAK